LVGILGASPKDCFGFPKNGWLRSGPFTIYMEGVSERVKVFVRTTLMSIFTSRRFRISLPIIL
jgi:hypothetical protein